MGLLNRIFEFFGGKITVNDTASFQRAMDRLEKQLEKSEKSVSSPCTISGLEDTVREWTRQWKSVLEQIRAETAIKGMFPMYKLTVDGLNRAMVKLMVNK